MDVARGRGLLTGNEPRSKVLEAINGWTKWVVSALVAAIFIWQHNTETCWCIMGAIICSFLGKGLKLIINQQRPPEARKADPGMPSSHATSLAYLATYGSGCVVYYYGDEARQVAMVAAILIAAILLSSLRVVLGYHTADQVSAGWLLGTTVASCWMYWGLSTVLPALQSHPAAIGFVFIITMAYVFVFVGLSMTSWLSEGTQRQWKE